MKKQFTELEAASPLPDSRLKRAVIWRINRHNKNLSNYRKDAGKMEYQEATNAQVYDAVQVALFNEVIQLGQVYRLALQAGEIGRAEEIKAYIEKVVDDINEVSPIKAIPIQKLVAIQVGAGLVTQQQLRLAA